MTKALITGISVWLDQYGRLFISKYDWDVIGMYHWRSPLENIKHLVPRINARDRVGFLMVI